MAGLSGCMISICNLNLLKGKMTMKRTFQTLGRHCYYAIAWSMLLLWLLLGVACTADDDEMEYNKKIGTRAVSLNLDTRSFGASDSLVNVMRIIVAKQDDAGTIVTNQVVSNPGNPLIIKTLNGLYDIYAIANESETPGDSIPVLKNTTTISELRTKMLAFDYNNRQETNLPMIGVVRDVSIIAPEGTPSEGNTAKIQVAGVDKGRLLPMAMTRLAVKVDLVILSKAYAGLEYVKLTNIPDSVSILGTYENTSNRKDMTVAMANSSDVLPGYIWQKQKLNIILPSNVFSSPTNSANALKMVVKVSGQDEEKIVDLGHLIEQSPKDFTLHPNTHYTFTGRFAGDRLQIDGSIANWTFIHSDYPIGGGRWTKEPTESKRIGINTPDGGSASFEAVFESNATVRYQWYQKYQTYNEITNKIETHLKALDNVSSDTLTITGAANSMLNIKTKKIDISGEIYCVASTFSPDSTEVRSESSHVTLMVVGENYEWPEKSFPYMHEFKAPTNVPLGSTCILQDERDKKVYHVKLMADGNWWMIQDLAFGGTLSTWTRNEETGILRPYVIAPDTHGMAIKTGLSTGGHFYNTYAAVQLSNSTMEAYETNKSVDKEYLASICPDGWHLPGNYGGKFNQEWFDFKQKNGLDYETVSGFEYNAPKAFNAYTLWMTDRFYLAGGCVTVRPGGIVGTEYFFRTQGALLGDGGKISEGTNTDDAVGTGDQVIIRCIKNFK